MFVAAVIQTCRLELLQVPREIQYAPPPKLHIIIKRATV